MSITRIASAPPAPEPDQVIELLQGLALEAQSSLRKFTEKLKPDAPPMEIATLAREVGNLFSFLVDLATHTTEAHVESYEWSAEIEEEVERLSADESRLSPVDAGRLKATLLSLVQHLRTPDDELTAAVRQRATEAIEFIDQVTISDEDEGDDEGDEGDEGES